jgi:hypothetical protein
VAPAHERIDVLCSDRKTMNAEDIISGQTLRELHFDQVFGESGADEGYDAVVIGVAPSLNLREQNSGWGPDNGLKYQLIRIHYCGA